MHEKLSLMLNSSNIFPILYDLKYIDDILKSRSKVVILGRVLNIMNISRVIDYLKSSKKMVIVDIDLVKGLSNDEYAIKYVSKKIGVDGIITTHASKIFEAKKENLISILKVFCYDEFSLESAIKNISYCSPDIIEALPGIAAPLFVKEIKNNSNVMIDVAGFLGNNIKEILGLFKFGISAIHTGDNKLWDIKNS